MGQNKFKSSKKGKTFQNYLQIMKSDSNIIVGGYFNTNTGKRDDFVND